ncbi:MAG TPA: pitrilysin family protein, partial [Polyangia bacterium]|nr:pitrilysin family protein [Polyangia bacterium]
MTRGQSPLLLLTPALAALSCSQPFIGDTGIRRFGFDLWDVHCPSGLRVVFEKDSAAGAIGVVTVVGVGSAEDPPGKEGLAHLVEHLAFRARHRQGPTVWDQMERLGATDLNAGTTFEATTYHEFAAKSRLDAILQLEGDRFTNPLEAVDEPTFTVEREVVRNELRQRNETGFTGQALNWIQAAVFPADHPYHHGVAGTHQSLSAITLDDARRFAAQHYRPDNMTMLVIGDVSLDGVEDFVRAHWPPALYGDPRKPVSPPASRVPNPAPAVPQVKPAGLERHQAAVSNPEAWVAWSIPGGFGRDKFIAAFWAALVAGNFNQGRFTDDPDIVDVSFHPIDGP